MAKIRLSGAVVGEASGSLGTTVFSHNRYGSYVRLRAVPTKVTSIYAQNQKGILSAASKIWGTLTDAQRLSWGTWAQTNPLIDRLGDKRILDGHAAVTRINANILTASGTPISDPPTVGAPENVGGLVGHYDIGAGNFDVAWTSGALGASEKLWVWAAVTDSPGRSYVNNLYKLAYQSALAATTPEDTTAAVEARFGTLVVGQQVFYSVQVVDVDTGLVSATYPLRGVVVST